MAGLALDDAAWASPWRTRAVLDKSVLALGLLVVALVLAPWPGSALAGVTACGCALAWARVPASLLARTLAAPLAFVVLSGLSVALSLGAPLPDAAWSFGPLSASPSSLERAAGLAVHAMAGCTCLVLLAATTPMSDLLAAARWARVPDACIEIAALMYRLVFVLLDSVGRIREAQAGRLGYSSLRRSFRSTASLVAGVLVRSWRRAQRLDAGLAGRGYESAMPTLAPERTHSPGFVAAGLGIVAAVAVVGVLLG